MISVIVPVYNTQDLLPACVDSILAQTERDWELLLIDDGSTDGSADICDSYHERDPRVQVVHKANAGVSAARNTGLDIARGEWVAFVDSDDQVAPAYLADMLHAAVATGADITCSGWLTSQGQRVEMDEKFITREGFQHFFCSYTNFGYVWGKLIRRSLFDDNGIRFPLNVHWAEDTLVMDSLIVHARSAAFVSAVNYLYTIRPGSGVMRLHSFDSEREGLLTAMRVLPQLDDLLPSKHLNSAFGFLWRTVLSLYQHEPDRRKRLRALAELPIERRRLWHRSTSRKEHLLTWLLKRRMFVPFDFLMSRAQG